MFLTLISMFVLLFSAWYVPFRWKRLARRKRIWPWQIAAFIFLAGYLLLLMSGLYTSRILFFAILYNIYGLLFIFYFYLFLYLFLTHLAGPLLKEISGKAILGAGVLLCAGIVGFGFFQARSFTVTKHEIQVRGLEHPVSILHIPDLHLGAQRSEAYVEKVLEVIRNRKPDMVIYNGDMVDSNIALRPELFALFRKVPCEQYFTTGNHEFYMDTSKALALIASSGIRILRNEMVETHGLQVIGLEYMNADKNTYDSHKVNDLTIEEELPKIRREKTKPSLLLHHSPVGMSYAAKGGINIMLTGHTHAGQLFPANLLVPLRFPMYKGRYQIGGTTLLVSQGAGTFGPWMRLGTFNEIQHVRLIPR